MTIARIDSWQYNPSVLIQLHVDGDEGCKIQKSVSHTSIGVSVTADPLATVLHYNRQDNENFFFFRTSQTRLNNDRKIVAFV
jgi:hypothetical protein